MTKLNKVTVFCGSRNGNHPEYAEKAALLGKYLAQNKIQILYGGGNCGLMDALAMAAIKEGGYVHGIGLSAYPQCPEGITSIILMDDLLERKKALCQADGFIAMPGSVGTIDEVFHTIGSAQARQHSKPIAFYNIRNFFDPLLGFIQQTADEGFMRREDTGLYFASNEPADLVQQMQQKLQA